MISCEGENLKNEPNKVEAEVIETGRVEEIAKKHIRRELSIPGNEKFTYHIYKEKLNDDGATDAIITVNRLEYAMNEAAKENNSAKKAEIGFMGNYNYIFFYDGKLKQISTPVTVPSSPLAQLKISFENVFSENYKDVLVDFRVLNASYKDFYTTSGGTIKRIFQWKNFDGLKSDESEAYYFEFAKGTMGPHKDIIVKKALLIQPKNEIDLYSFEPEIEKKNEVVHKFFYHPEGKKYMTLKN